MQGDGWIVIDYAHNIFTAAIIGDWFINNQSMIIDEGVVFRIEARITQKIIKSNINVALTMN